MESIKVGDRVHFFTLKDKIGIITNIALTEFPFYVIWDDTKCGGWYVGTCLSKICISNVSQTDKS